jgi:excinuclease ABC subunit A
MEKPDVDQITGLSPAISIDQKSTSHNPRSTVATVTEVYDYLRLLFARIGVPHCPICGKPVTRRTSETIIDEIMKLPGGAKLMIWHRLVKDKKGEFAHIPEQYSRQGFAGLGLTVLFMLWMNFQNWIKITNIISRLWLIGLLCRLICWVA